MSETKHTPGPWKAGKASKSLSRHIDLWVADVDSRDLLVAADVRGIGEVECLANARLIAAAPELAEALRECITDQGAPGMQEGLGRMRRRLEAINTIARDVLAKLEAA